MGRVFGFLVIGVLALSMRPAAAQSGDGFAIGLLKFGTVNWEMNVLFHHHLDRPVGARVEIKPMANNQATKIAILGGAVDMIVTDWIWVARQRAAGADLTFVPYSKAVGAMVVPANSGIQGLADLEGKRLGIAGGPLDKSWLLLRARSQQELGFDLDTKVEKVFGSPPLLNQQILDGKIDAVINFWHYVARLEANGFRRLFSIADTMEALGVSSHVPLVGYAFSTAWGDANRDRLTAFFAATRKAKEILRTSDAEWERIRPDTKAKDDATLHALRDGYRAGIPEKWGAAERDAARRMLAILAEYGGEKLIGPGKELAPGTFWPAVSY